MERILPFIFNIINWIFGTSWFWNIIWFMLGMVADIIFIWITFLIEDHRAKRKQPILTRHQLYSLFSQTERLQKLDEWLELAPAYSIPKWPVASHARQTELQESRPLQFGSINSLFNVLDMPEYCFSVPMREREFRRLQRRKDQAVTRIRERIPVILSLDSQKRTELIRCLHAVYDYVTQQDAFSEADVALVFGNRQTYRAERAGQLLVEGTVQRIYLSGYLASYDSVDDNVLRLSEALAMLVYLLDRQFHGQISPDQVIVESSFSRETAENLPSRRELSELCRELGTKKLSIAIVTSPYHLMRTFLLCQQLKQDHANLIGNLYRVAAHDPYTEDNWYEKDEGRGLQVYLTEYWKLHGGRVTGQY